MCGLGERERVKDRELKSQVEDAEGKGGRRDKMAGGVREGPER